MTAVSEAGLADQLRALIRIARVARQRLAVPATQVQPGMTGVLAALRHASADEVCHAKELAARCGLDASTISRAVTTLVTRGLVQRTADPTDGRASILTLTAAGRATLTDIERQQAELLAGALGDWTAPEVDAFAAALTRFIDDATTYLDRTSPQRTPPAGSGDTSAHQTSTLEATL
ncbi:MAG TPA: MarR family transcriptional regulator [Planosporangium sp.]|jgi:DNA-binding MarR family transcriptional regulator|nr:MarR family transcriptional regulator [Planosporangium sp.]